MDSTALPPPLTGPNPYVTPLTTSVHYILRVTAQTLHSSCPSPAQGPSRQVGPVGTVGTCLLEALSPYLGPGL